MNNLVQLLNTMMVLPVKIVIITVPVVMEVLTKVVYLVPITTPTKNFYTITNVLLLVPKELMEKLKMI